VYPVHALLSHHASLHGFSKIAHHALKKGFLACAWKLVFFDLNCVHLFDRFLEGVDPRNRAKKKNIFFWRAAWRGRLKIYVFSLKFVCEELLEDFQCAALRSVAWRVLVQNEPLLNRRARTWTPFPGPKSSALSALPSRPQKTYASRRAAEKQSLSDFDAKIVKLLAKIVKIFRLCMHHLFLKTQFKKKPVVQAWCPSQGLRLGPWRRVGARQGARWFASGRWIELLQELSRSFEARAPVLRIF